MIKNSSPSHIHYAWIVVAVTFVLVLAAAGVRSVPGVLIIPLEEEFGWNRAIISLAVSINLLLFGFIGPFAAAILERFGMRRLMVAALLVLAVSVALTTQMNASWQLQLLWGLAVGLGTGAMGGWMAATVANRWFVRRRGLAVGLLTAGTAAGQLLFLPILAWLVVTFGWRMSVLFIAGFCLLAVPLVAKFIRTSPEEIGLRPYGATDDDSDAQGLPALPPKSTENPFMSAFGILRHGLGSRDYLLLAGSFFVCGASTNGLIGTHLIPASIEHGIPEVTAASFLSLIAIFNMAGSTLSGWLTDRFDGRWLLICYYSLRGLSLLFLPSAYEAGSTGLIFFIVFYGLDWVATVPPTVRITADIFGRDQVGNYYAWIMVVHQFGAAAIAFGAGAMRAWLGNYDDSFMLSGFLCILAAGLVVQIRKSAQSRALPALASSAGQVKTG